MAVTVNTGMGVKAIRLDTGRSNSRFYHFATMKYVNGAYSIVKYRYDMYGDKAEGLMTDQNGQAEFVVDGGSVAIWLEDGVGLE